MKQAHYQSLYDHELSHWWYKARRMLVFHLIERYAGLKGLKILDVGCGAGALLKDLGAYGDAYGVDMSDQALDFCRQRGITNIRKGDAVDLPYADDIFDVVLALDVLEHIKDDRAAAKEIMRVLKPGGLCIVFVPAFPILWGITDVLSEHVRRYRMPELKKTVESAGLKTVRASYFNFFLFFPILAVRLFVRAFRIRASNENDMASGVMNDLLYRLFRCEISLLKAVSFPFGVSIFMVSRK